MGDEPMGNQENLKAATSRRSPNPKRIVGPVLRAAVRKLRKIGGDGQKWPVWRGNCRTEDTQRGPGITENRAPICINAAFGRVRAFFGPTSRVGEFGPTIRCR